MKKSSNPELSEALAFDPIAEAERRTGLDYKENEGVVWLGMAIGQQQGQTKDALLLLNDDTRWSLTFPEFCELVERMGFKMIHERPVMGKDYEDVFRVYWSHEGLLLQVESYWGSRSEKSSVNSAKVYFNFCGDRGVMRGCSSGFAGELDGQNAWEGSYDAREGLRHTLDEIRTQGLFLPKWIKRPFLWLLTYMDPKTEGYDYDSINARTIETFPESVQRAITPIKP